MDLRTHNTTLLLKYVHKFYNKMDLPWVSLTWQCLYTNGTPPHKRKGVGSFWWRDIMFLVDQFFMIVSCQVQRGDSSHFGMISGILVYQNGNSSSYALLQGTLSFL